MCFRVLARILDLDLVPTLARHSGVAVYVSRTDISDMPHCVLDRTDVRRTQTAPALLHIHIATM